MGSHPEPIIVCSRCRGDGTVPCPRCGGEGIEQTIFGRQTCRTCHGEPGAGRSRIVCKGCAGEGRRVFTREQQLAPTEPPPAPKACTCCGATYDAAQWDALPYVGIQDGGPGYPGLEMRNCASCKSTLIVELPFALARVAAA